MKCFDLEKVVGVLKTERECVRRQIRPGCDRQCLKCDLVLPDSLVLEAYDTAIELVSDYEETLMKHYKQGRLDETADREGCLIQTFSPD